MTTSGMTAPRRRSLGFGLERIGLLADRRPLLFTLLLVVMTVLAGLQMRNVTFDGNVTAVLPSEAPAFRDYVEQRGAFRDFTRDVFVLVRSPRLKTAAGLEDLRGLHLELALATGVEGVFSVFSLPRVDAETGDLPPFIPDMLESDEQAATSLGGLLARYPQASSLYVPDRDTAVLVVTLQGVEEDGREKTYPSFVAMKEAVAAAAPADFEVHYSGLTPIGITIIGALLDDQLRLTLVGIVLGALISFAVFRNLASALICSVPPVLTAVWTLGMFGAADLPINYLTTMLPTLALILAFADTIVLQFRWQAEGARTGDWAGALTDALRTVGPASALTSITTAIAFASFLLASGSALKQFALLGMGAVSIAFLAVIIGLPVAGYWARRLGMLKGTRAARGGAGGIGALGWRVASGRPGVVAAVSIALIALLALAHVSIRPEYRVVDYLPRTSDARVAEDLANETVGGRSIILVSLPKAEPGSPLAPANLDRLEVVEGLAARVFGADSVFSLRDIARDVQTEAARERLAEQLGGEIANSPFESRDRGSLLITVRIPSDQPIERTRVDVAAFEKALGSTPFGDAVTVTGFDVLMAQEFTRLIEQLRSSLLLAIGLGVVVVGLAARSWRLGLAALTPNLLPILVVELLLWMKGGTINISEVIALTIGFGIAIDNAVHILNAYVNKRDEGLEDSPAIRAALLEVGPALMASLVIICVATLVTQLSALPMIPVLGRLIIATLSVALVANLIILPANLLLLHYLRGPRRRPLAPAASTMIEKGETT